jgi:hypothetical protein
MSERLQVEVASCTLGPVNTAVHLWFIRLPASNHRLFFFLHFLLFLAFLD